VSAVKELNLQHPAKGDRVSPDVLQDLDIDLFHHQTS
jgi:hypothetical protein